MHRIKANLSSHGCPDNHGHGPTPYDLPIPHGLKEEWKRLATRRHFLGKSGKALGWAALASLIGEARLSASVSGAAQPGHTGGSLGATHFPAAAKRVIYLFMSGAPPQMDTLDYKPGLADWFDKDLPESVRGTAVPTGMTSGQSRFPIAPSHWGFKQHGTCGRWISDLLPWTGKMADDIAVLSSVHTDAINHEPAILLMNTGNMVPGKPAIGAWLSYGLGSMNENLPTFVVLNTNPTVGNMQPITSRLWGSGFLSSQHAGVLLRAAADPVLYLRDPNGMDRDMRRTLLDGVAALNQRTYEELGDPETQSRITQYELAFRMQTSVPELADLSNEPQSTWSLYGEEARKPGSFAYNCLMARRLAERGVRFTQVYKRGWDVHGDCVGVLPALCKETDHACYALVTDLKQRGILDDTLVIHGGEFGRTVYSQGGLSHTNYGRDHHSKCFSMWMAGGGIKGGISYGKTDDFSFSIVENPVHVRDFGATVLHTLGINHEKLAFRFGGLDQKLTGVVPAQIVRALLA